jgi:FkbM family methyltransferase
MWYVLFFIEILRFHTSVNLTFSYKKTLCTLRAKNKYDIAVLKEIFLFKEYEWKEITNPKIIIDLGAHIGDTALYYHCEYPDAKIYAIEPDPFLFERLCENSKNIENIVPVHAAISDVTGTSTLHVSSKSSLRGSLTDRSGTDSAVEVPTLNLSDFYAKYDLIRADIIKFDIEGAEKMMFGTKNAIAYADAYIGELHCDLAHMQPEEFLKSFEGFKVDIKPMRRKERFNLKAIKSAV